GLLLAIDVVAGLAGRAQRREGRLEGVGAGGLAGRGGRGAHFSQALFEVGLVFPDLRIGRRLGVRAAAGRIETLQLLGRGGDGVHRGFGLAGVEGGRRVEAGGFLHGLADRLHGRLTLFHRVAGGDRRARETQGGDGAGGGPQDSS